MTPAWAELKRSDFQQPTSRFNILNKFGDSDTGSRMALLQGRLKPRREGLNHFFAWMIGLVN